MSDPAESSLFRRALPRRDWLRCAVSGGVLTGSGVFGTGLFGTGLLANALFGSRSARAETGAGTRGDGKDFLAGVRRVKSVIVVFTSGGQSQIDLWDPKPLAPREIRGEFETIRTSVPGTLLGEHLPRLASLAHKYTLVRSMSHRDADHGSAVYLTLTGQYHQRITSNPQVRPTDLPSLQSVYKRLRPEARCVDPSVQINGPAIVAPNDIAPGQFGGLLGREFDPLFVGNILQDDGVVPGLDALEGLSTVRQTQRERLLAQVAPRADMAAKPQWADFDHLQQRAFDLISDPQTRRAFDLGAEPDSVRERYGRSRGGRSCLLARRLVEAGVPFVTVVWNHHNRGQDEEPHDDEAYGWDTHNDIFESLKNRLLPRFDRSLSALIEDLDERGLLDETLVVCVGEFGRAPLVALEPNFKGATPGRKHWASAYSILLAGGGTAAGKVVGRTDQQGAWPASEAYGPWDLAATLYAALGIDPAGHYFDPQQRPYPLCAGQPIRAVYEG
jgi:hypothetical protein